MSRLLCITTTDQDFHDFVDRDRELGALEWWWAEDARAAMVWGRRRVGKTALVQRFTSGKQAVFHTGAGRGEAIELSLLAEQAMVLPTSGSRDLHARPYISWDDALDDLAARSVSEDVLLVLDEFPELVTSTPALPNILRAFLDRSRGRTRLRVLLCGSAVRQMEALESKREPLYGRFDLNLQLHPFAPPEAALMLPSLAPADRARVYGIVGGMPLYLSWWDQGSTLQRNLRRLVLEPGGRLLAEGEVVLRTETEGGEYGRQVLTAIASGRTQYGEIKDVIRAEPARTIERLMELRLVERIQPVGEPERSRRRSYRIVDPFLRFYLGIVGWYRSAIERGLGQTILPVLLEALDDHMGTVWEEAFRQHLLRRVQSGELPVSGPVVAIGPWWDGPSDNEIDAVMLAGRTARPVLVGEAKWAKTADAGRLVADLWRKVEHGLKVDPDSVLYAVCARNRLTNVPDGVLAFTADDLFAPPS